jgi:hypothetical protein
VSGTRGTVLTSDGNAGTYWTVPGQGQVERKKWSYTVADLPSGAIVDFDIEIGLASIVYALTVSRPVLVEVFATATKDETNPYTFLATLDHLVDDGTVLLNDGSVIQQRQYSIFANQEEPAQNKVYGRITNIDGTAGPVEISLTYYNTMVDTSAGSYNTNVVSSLPASGYSGQTVLLKTDNKLYVYYDGNWNPVA